MLNHHYADKVAETCWIILTVAINALHVYFLQNFYLWKKDKKTLKDIKEKDKELLIQVKYAHTQTRSEIYFLKCSRRFFQWEFLSVTPFIPSSLCRRTSAGLPSLCLISRRFCTSKKTARSPGNSGSSSWGLQEFITCPKGRQRSEVKKRHHFAAKTAWKHTSNSSNSNPGYSQWVASWPVVKAEI